MRGSTLWGSLMRQLVRPCRHLLSLAFALALLVSPRAQAAVRVRLQPTAESADLARKVAQLKQGGRLEVNGYHLFRFPKAVDSGLVSVTKGRPQDPQYRSEIFRIKKSGPSLENVVYRLDQKNSTLLGL